MCYTYISILFFLKKKKKRWQFITLVIIINRNFYWLYYLQMEDIYNSLMELLFNVEIKANVEYQNATFSYWNRYFALFIILKRYNLYVETTLKYTLKYICCNFIYDQIIIKQSEFVKNFGIINVKWNENK